ACRPTAFSYAVSSDGGEGLIDAWALRTGERVTAGSRDAADGHGPRASESGAAVVVDDMLDYDEVRRIIVVGDGTRLGLTQSDGATAAHRAGLGVTRNRTFGHRKGSDRRQRLVDSRRFRAGE